MPVGHAARELIEKHPIIVFWFDGPMLKGRLVGLREERRTDVEALFELDADVELFSLTSARPFQPRTLASWQAEYDKRQAEQNPKTTFFTIQRLDDEAREALGSVGLWQIDLHNRSAHIGISLLPSVQGKGFGRDALDVICRFGFDVRGLERLSLETLETNGAMRAVAVACGFVEEGRLRSAAWYLGRRVDEVVYGLLADEWRAHQRPSDGG